MNNEITVSPNKNLFLLYAMLDVLGLMRGERNFHPLRERTYEHFKSFQGLDLKEKDYLHHSKAVAYVLTLTDAPKFEEQPNLNLSESMVRDVVFGKVIRPHLLHFYRNTDFKNYYQTILSEYEDVCTKLRQIINGQNINKLLNDVWEVKAKFNMITIPIPLEGRFSGIGVGIADIAYQIVGPPFGKRIVLNICHEGSHPRAKALLAPLLPEIDKASFQFDNLQRNNPKWPKSYNNWRIAFEEHLIRALQAVLINPRLGIRSTEASLEIEENDKGMRFIRQMAEEIIKYQEAKNETLREAVISIIERLLFYKVIV